MWPRALVLLLVIAIASLLLPACGRQNTAEHVAGTVVDTAGKPLAGVRVFNRGDGPKPVETHTDASGCFRLVGLNAGTVYVFADKADYRFAGVRTTAGATGLVVRLLRQAEPAPTRPVASPPMPLDEQRGLARRMLAKLWAEDARSKDYYRVVVAMSHIDPDLALRWASDSVGDWTDLVRAGMAEKIAAQDFDEALGLLTQSGFDGLISLVRLAHRYAASDPVRARRCVEELVVGARAIDQPWRAAYLAQAGGLAIRLGNQEAGRKLLDEAEQTAAKLGSQHQHAGARAMVARAMAPTDLKRALALLEPIGPQDEPDRLRLGVAVAICQQDLGQALAMVGKVEPSYPVDADCARLRMACRLAPTRPADAVRVAEMIGNHRQNNSGDGQRAKATAMGRLAVAVAPRDKSLACALIDRAFAILLASEEPPSSSEVWGSWPAGAGFVALQAGQIGYPDMESVAARVLARRPSKKHGPGVQDASDIQALQSEIIMATFFALVDRQAAQEVLHSVEAQSGALRPEADPALRWAWLKAWALVEPKRGQALFDEAATSIKGGPADDSQFYDLVGVADLLAAPPSEKARHIAEDPQYRSLEEE